MFLLLSAAMIVSLFVGFIGLIAFSYDAIIHPNMSPDEFTLEGVFFGSSFILTAFIIIMNAVVIN